MGNMLASESKSFYTIKEGATYFYNIPTKTQTKIPQDSFIILNNIRESKKVE
jgi:3-hydroxyacyl-CoA dehydrogenase